MAHPESVWWQLLILAWLPWLIMRTLSDPRERD